MKKSEMSAKQIQSRTWLLTILQNTGWTPHHTQTFEDDLPCSIELSAKKRNQSVLMDINVSYENSYVSIMIMDKSEHGVAQYLVYFNKIETAYEIFAYIHQQSDTLSVLNSINLAQNLCDKYPDEVYFFDGWDSHKLTKATVKQVFERYNV